MKSFKQSLDEMDTFSRFLEEDTENIRRVVNFCEEKGADVDFEIHAKAETCEESVQHSDIELEQIIKTLVFIADRPVAVLCPGHKRVSESKLSDVLDACVRLANPSEVKEHTGYVVGGVSPFDLDIDVLLEESIIQKDTVRPAAGSRLVGATLSSEELLRLTDGKIADVAE